MKVLLRENIQKLGKRGDVVTVASGYARNYLLPRQLAWPASKEFERRLDAEKRKYDARMSELKEAMEELSQKLANTELTIKARASEDGRLFGSVTARDVLDAFEKEGITLDSRSLNFDAHIKEVGVYQFSLKLHPDLEPVDIKFWVVDENEPDHPHHEEEEEQPADEGE